MGKKFAVFDIDGTLFRSQLYYEVVLNMARRGVLHPKLNESTLQLHQNWRKRVSKNAFEVFDREVITAIDQLIPELSPQQYDKHMKASLEPLLDYTYIYTKNLLENLRSQGYFLLAISGSRIEEVNLFAKHHKFDDWIGQTYHRSSDGRSYTGDVTKTYKDKHLILQDFVKKHGLDYADSYAVGDTGGDISLLEAVDNPIVFNPNQVLLDEAMRHGWKIVIERKSIAYIMEPQDGRYILAKTD